MDESAIWAADEQRRLERQSIGLYRWGKFALAMSAAATAPSAYTSAWIMWICSPSVRCWLKSTSRTGPQMAVWQ